MNRARRWALLAVTAALVAGPALGSDGDAAYEFALAKLLAAEGSWREAAEAFARAAGEQPGDPYVHVDYAAFLLQLGRRTAALEQAEMAHRLAPEDPDVLAVFARAQLAAADGDETAVELAREAYETLRRVRPEDLQSLVALGRLYLEGGDPDEAAAVLGEALAQRPGNGWLLSLRVEALLRADRPAEAEPLLAELLRVEPGEARARLTLAELQQKRGDADAAAATLAAAPPEVMADVDYRRRLGFALYRAGDLVRALELADGVLVEEAGDFGGLYLKSLVLAAEGRHRQASSLLQELVSRRPESLELALLTARVLERQQAVDEARELLARVAERLRAAGSEEEAELADYETLNLLSRAGRWQELLAATGGWLERAADPSLDLELLHLDTLARLGRGDEALARLAALQASELTATRRLAKEAELLFALDRNDEARQRLERLRRRAEPEGRLSAARLFHGREQYAEVIPILEALEPPENESIQVLFWLGAAYERTGRHEPAERAFRRLLELDESFAPALNYLGYMWAELGQNLDEALGLIQRAVAMEPDNGAYVDSLGWVKFRLGEYEQARDLLERAARLIPEDAVIYEHLGDVYLAVGQPAEARRHYERALSLDGENADAVSGKLDRLRRQL